MKYLDEYRDAEAAHNTRAKSPAITTRPWTLMEVCGGQTHAIVKFGLDELLPETGHPHPRAGLSGLRHAGGAD